MASIFGGAFVDNLRRIYSSAKLPPAAEPLSTEVGASFEKVLGDLERGEKVSQNKELSAVPEPPADARFQLSRSLSNFSITEERDTRLRLDPAPEPPNSGIEMKCEGVKIPASAPQPQPETEMLTALPPARVHSEERARLAWPAETAPKFPPAHPGPPKTPQIHEALRERVPFMEGFRPGSDRLGNIKAMIERAGDYHGVDPFLSLAVARHESAFRPDAVSRDGHYSKGVFQLLDSTAHDMMERVGWSNEYDPFDPALNTHLGVGYLRRLHDLFSHETDLGFDLRTVPGSTARDREKLAVAAFNAGEGRVTRAQRRAEQQGSDPAEYESVAPYLPRSTRTYVERVIRSRDEIASRTSDSDFV
jgi:soluble lytic murein transglycosylase-like protein